MSTTKKSQQLYQYSKLERPVRKDCNTNNKIHCTPCPQQTSSETKAEGWGGVGWGGVGWGVGGVGVGVVIRCCRDMAAFLENNRPVHPVVHHWFIIFHFQLGSNPSHCRLETDYCQGQNIHLFTLPTGNGLLPGPKHPPLHTADWKWIIARAKTSTSSHCRLETDYCQGQNIRLLLPLISSTASQCSWRPLCLTPGVSVTCLCSVHVQHLSPRNRTILSFVCISQQAYPLSPDQNGFHRPETSSPFTVPHTTQTLKNKCCPSTAFDNRSLSLSLLLSPDPNRFGQVTILCSEQTGAFPDLSCFSLPRPPPPPPPGCPSPSLQLQLYAAPPLLRWGHRRMLQYQDAAVPAIITTSSRPSRVCS